MAKITIFQLETSDSYINALSNTELDATKGGDGEALGLGGLIGAAVETVQVGLVNANVSDSLNDNNVSLLSSGNTGDVKVIKW
ncbi:hypothetical protein [Brasilonema sp. UFV-L1]|uniref:hypothetical protein n=1 Tax=Brasilonema sp. UFV-L1 TaxID=2234130 RepID=UPI00145CEF79|nr:hypothetical protein [Brasilonema sp. UFV-L1]NMG09335.1 hypothetical protein [Brasilonema sp. UFV-L1]